MRKCSWSENLKGRDHLDQLRDLTKDGRIGYIWLRILSSGGLFENMIVKIWVL
jgi:hypothetical protein